MPLLQNFQSAALGGQPLWTKDAREISIRALSGWFFLGPILFVAIEGSPTAWAIGAAICSAGTIFASSGLLNRRPAAGLTKAAVILLALSFFVALSTVWSIDPKRSLLATRDLFGYSVIAMVVLHGLSIIPDPACSRVLTAFTGGIAIAIAIVVARELAMAWPDASAATRVAQAITLHKITFYGALFAVALLTIRTPISLALVVIFAAATLLYGRSTGINLAIAVIAAIYALRERQQRAAFTIFVIAYIALAVLAPLLAPILFAWLDRMGVLEFYQGTFAARLEIWSSISAHIWSAPFFGHGANTVRNATWLIDNPKYYVDQDLPSSHNIVMDLWFELGVTGVVLFCASIAALARAINTLKAPTHFMCAATLIVILIEMSVDHRIWLSWVLGTLIMAAAACTMYSRSVSPHVRDPASAS